MTRSKVPTNIDLIYRWINPDTGRKKLAQIAVGQSVPKLGEMNCPNRFRDNNELRYSLRSIARYAPWVSKIHILGEGPPPKWLGKHRLINWFDLHQLFASRGVDVPLNSETVKLLFHEIPELSEFFICFDDDWFLGSRVSKADFFTSNGMPIQPSADHAPVAWTKTLYRQALSALPFRFLVTIRKGSSARLDPWPKMREALLREALIKTAKESNPSVLLCNTNYERYAELLSEILQTRPQRFCLNDDWSLDEREYELEMQSLARFFETMYPTAAPWENDLSFSTRIFSNFFLLNRFFNH